MLGWIVLLLVVAALAYIRLAPSDPARWHKAAAAEGVESISRKNGYIWRKALAGDGKAELQALVEAATGTARTSLLAGSVEERQITFVTRTLVMGFPDHTTMGVYQAPSGETYIEAYGRLRFGNSDLGVNARRIKSWVADAGL